MSYLTEKYPASFRGVPFKVEGHTTTFGRKTAVYKLPFESKGVAHLDLGRAPRRFRMKAFLIESLPDKTLRAQRDELVAALETPGAGLLVHPIYGRVNVIVEDNINFLESTQQGGMIEVELEFVEAREAATQTKQPDAQAEQVKKARALRTAAGQAFEKRFNLDVPDFVAKSNLAVLDNVLDGLRQINALIGQTLKVPSHFAAQIDRIANEMGELIHTPKALFDAVDYLIVSMIQSAYTAFGLPRRNPRSGLGSLSFTIGASAALGALTAEPTGSTPAREQERVNRAVTLVAFRASALGASAEVAANFPFTSANEARSIMLDLVDALTGLSDNDITGVEPDSDTYDALRELQAATTSHLSGVAGSLSELTTHIPVATIPAVVLAYRLYGDTERYEEILNRNIEVTHPLFVPGAIELEVLAP